MLVAQSDLRCFTHAQMDNLMREQMRIDGREFNPSSGDSESDESNNVLQSVWFWVMIAACSGAHMHLVHAP